MEAKTSDDRAVEMVEAFKPMADAAAKVLATMPPKVAKRVKRLVDVRVECEVPNYITRHARDHEHKARLLSEWAREFAEFIRDHRSQDPVRLDVVRDEREVCSCCGNEWETTVDDDTEETICASCGVKVG
jgi:hypothetical protein